MFKPRDVIIGVLVAAIWGGNYVFTKFALKHTPPFLFLGIRFLIVSVILIPFVPKLKMPFKELLILSISLGLLHHGLLFYAIDNGIDLASSIIILNLSVPITSILSVIILKEKLKLRVALGISTAFIGLIILVGNPSLIGGKVVIAAALISSFGISFVNVRIKLNEGNHPLSILAYTSLLSNIIMFSLSIILEMPIEEGKNILSTVSIFGLLYNVFSSIGGFGLWCYLLNKYPAYKVAPFSLLVPIFGISFTKMAFDITLSENFILGSTITLLSVILIIFTPKKA